MFSCNSVSDPGGGFFFNPSSAVLVSLVFRPSTCASSCHNCPLRCLLSCCCVSNILLSGILSAVRHSPVSSLCCLLSCVISVPSDALPLSFQEEMRPWLIKLSLFGQSTPIVTKLL